MGGFGRWASSHTGTLVAILIVLAFVVAGSVARCTAIHVPEEVERTPEDLADDELPTEDRALRKSYDDVTKEALGLLSSNAWVDTAGSTVVEPTAKSIHVRTKGDDSWVAFVVTASARKTVTEEGVTSAVTTLCLKTPEWCDLATLTVPSTSAAEGEPRAPTLWCPSICGGSELTLSAALKDIEIDGPEEAVLATRGTSLEAVRAKVAKWCGTWRPTATMASWTKIIEEDHEERVWRLRYKLDDQRGTTVTLSIGMDDGKLAIEEGGM